MSDYIDGGILPLPRPKPSIGSPCGGCGGKFEKLLHITVTNTSQKELPKSMELVPLCMECFLRYAGVSFPYGGIPERWLE